MNLTSRLKRLEQEHEQKPKVYVVEQDRDKDHMEIFDLSFSGTIEDGNAIMDKHPYDQFLVFEGTLED